MDANSSLAINSEPGANILCVAPGSSVVTCDRTGNDGYSDGNCTSISGTSFSSSLV